MAQQRESGLDLQELTERAESYARLCGHDKVTRHPIGKSVQQILYHVDAIGRTLILESKQHNGTMPSPIAKDKLAKVLVVGEEDAVLSCSAREDVRIISLRHRLRNGQDIVAKAAQIGDHCRTGGFIDQELHSDGFLCRSRQGENVFVGQNLGGIGQRCTDILRLQPWVL